MDESEHVRPHSGQWTRVSVSDNHVATCGFARQYPRICHTL